MSLPVAQAPSIETVPLALRPLKGWLLWRYEPGPKKPLKVPYYVNGSKRYGEQGTPRDRASLATLDDALAALTPGFGLGFAPQADMGVSALDFDACVIDGVVDPAVEDLVATTYAEYSPSGNGVRAFVLGDLGDRKSRATPERFGFETFHGKGFVTITGRVLPGCELAGAEVGPASAQVIAFAQSRFGARTSGPGHDDLERAVVLAQVDDDTMVDLRDALGSLDSDDRDQWVDAGLALKATGHADAFEIWRDWSATSDKFDETEAEEKWEGFAPTKLTHRSIFKAATTAGWVNPKAGSVKTQPAEIAPSDKPRFYPYSLSELADRPPQSYFVRDVIPRAPLVVVFGESGAGKTFAVLDLVMAVARGHQWRDKRVEHGRVVYVAAEGQGGFGGRLKAYCMHHGVEATLPFRVITDVPNLLSEDHKAVAKAVEAEGGADLIVIDTLAQTTAGANENSGEDMGLALKHCAALNRTTGATILLVHHAGKDVARGARGWSGLKAAADAEISVERIGDSRVLRVTKMKDGSDSNVAFGFRLATVSIGMDSEGDLIESAVVESAEVAKREVKGLGATQKAVLAAVQDCIGVGESAPLASVMAYAIGLLGAPLDGKRDRRAEHVSRALSQLESSNVIKTAGSQLSIVKN